MGISFAVNGVPERASMDGIWVGFEERVEIRMCYQPMIAQIDAARQLPVRDGSALEDGVGGRLPWFGNLSGDITIRRDDFTVYKSIGTMMVVGHALTAAQPHHPPFCVEGSTFA